MAIETSRVCQEALALPPADRAALAQLLLSSLDDSDSRIDELWAREAEDRLAAFRAGTMDAVSLEEVFEEFNEL